ncbi:MAG TPA: hypothetical protein K8V11_02600 [Dietzia timorensis]|uniref:Uncharacterized protein n=1 Tax=Dietzia timorensis TaxID=499555 RepID=A0A173LMR7_9ACTN|nr:hypothetical protein [Dietzia timorensis]ANI93576.1 Hypothetical protein BJL86_2816 [Dietzia timorensis]HJE89886.1 hypothetical protein [Dietzia timorensis]
MTAGEKDHVPTPDPDDEAAVKVKHDHDDDMADEWGRESFPASDPPEY